ncbi:MAG: PIN domain-containing protein [Betaproteobacteria bacterium]|nr:PIN domain-containing protein [Betaproteobacteria bacterium]
MLLVDTSVWIDFLAGRTTRAVEYFRGRLEAREAFALTELIYLEVLQGVREPDAARKISAYLRGQLFLAPRRGLQTYDAAADLYRRCRAAGVTVRSTIDCLVAQTAVDYGMVLLHSDRDYERIARVEPRLKLAP